MKKLSILILCLTLTNCQVYGNLKENLRIKKEEKAKIREFCKEYEGFISVGMPKKCLSFVMGRSIRQNESCNSRTGCITQYVYYDFYVYVKDGKVTSWRSK